jgi:hypothetical protein
MSEYKVIREFDVTTEMGHVSERQLFEVDGELFITSRVYKGLPEDCIAVFPADENGDIHWDRYMDNGFEFFEVANADHESAIMQWLDQR